MTNPVYTYNVDYRRGRQLGTMESFARTSVGTYFDKLGEMRTAPVNGPRFDFDPVTLASKGLMSEMSSINLLPYSEFPNGLSDAASSSGNVSATTTMQGFPTAIQFSGPGAVYQRFTREDNVIFCFSIFIEMNDGGAPAFNDTDILGPSTDFVINMFGAVASNVHIEPMGGRLYRAWGLVNGSYPGAPDNACGVWKYDNNSPRAFKTSGFQMERSNYATSYIKTLATAVTRARTQNVVTSSKVFKIINPTEGTLFFEGLGDVGIVAHSNLLSIDMGSANDCIGIQRSVSNTIAFYSWLNGSNQVTLYTTKQFDASKPVKAAVSFRKNQFLGAVNGEGHVIATTFTPPPFDRLRIGDGPSTQGWRGHIYSWGTQGRALSLAELMEITK